MRSSFISPILLIATILSLFPAGNVRGQIDYPAGSSMRYLKGKDAATLQDGWMEPGFDDSGWSAGDAPLHYGDGTGGTLLQDMQYNYSVVYMRATFAASNVDSLEALVISLDYDDGFVIWINGHRVLSQFAPVELSHNAFATENHESGLAESFAIEPGNANLVEGENLLAVQGFNISLESSDFLFDAGITARRLVPVFQDTTGLEFSVSSGFCDTAFYLQITPADTAWDVVYTLDGSNPQDSETAAVSRGGARIRIDPMDPGGRPATPAVIVRASASMDGIRPSFPDSRTYIFPGRVMVQGYPGGGWPTGSINDQVIDLAMDSRIVTHAAYGDLMVPSLMDIPSISIITDLDHLFDPQTGIYVNAGGHGHAWERECSVELIKPDGSDGFHVNAGLRIRGGWSRHPEFAKHSFRLFFRDVYGDSKLGYPLFDQEGVDQYDKIDLRTAQNYAWSNGDPRNTFLRDLFSRDSQRDMGQPYTRSRYYHLYLNGMYWGLYQSQERSEARFASDYLGGNSADYDVIKVNTENYAYQIEASDGDFTLWHDLWNMCNAGFSSNTDYFKLEGKDAEGNPVPGGQVYLDLDNLIDYMLTIFYTGNFDAPTSSFGWNKGPNNFFAINSRVDRSRGFTFYNHDAEHSMFSEAIDPGTGLYEDRVNLTLRTDGRNMEVDHFGAFHPQWLHQQLTGNPEYRVRFMDRARLHLEEGGALTPSKNLVRMNIRAEEIDTAIIAESARWGDARPWVSFPFTRNADWIPQVQKIREEYFPFRTDILIGQLEEAGLFSTVDAPVVSMDGIVVQGTRTPVDGPTTLMLENLNGEGTICYTTDGTDPRLVGGRIAPSAKVHDGPVLELEFGSSAVVKARVFNRRIWSGLKEVNLISKDQDLTNLAITELHYHPEAMFFQGDTISDKDLEFIELKNCGEDALDLWGLVLDSAIYYEFPNDALLPPGRFYVVASKPSAFYLRYGLVASGNFQKNLSNGGEEVLLRDTAGNQVIRFVYSDDAPWPTEADGAGYSLVSAEHNPSGDPALPGYWKHSLRVGGSPFANDPFPLGVDPLQAQESGVRLYPNPTSGILYLDMPGRSSQGVIFTLYGIKGEFIHQVNLQGGGTIHLEELDLSTGIYVARIQTGQEMHTRKIIFNK